MSEVDFSGERNSSGDEDFEQEIKEAADRNIYESVIALLKSEDIGATVDVVPYTLQRLPYALRLTRKVSDQGEKVYIDVIHKQNEKWTSISQGDAFSSLSLSKAKDNYIVTGYYQNPTRDKRLSPVRIKNYVYAIEQVDEQMCQAWADHLGTTIYRHVEPHAKAVVESTVRRGGFRHIEGKRLLIKEYIPKDRKNNG